MHFILAEQKPIVKMIMELIYLYPEVLEVEYRKLIMKKVTFNEKTTKFIFL